MKKLKKFLFSIFFGVMAAATVGGFAACDETGNPDNTGGGVTTTYTVSVNKNIEEAGDVSGEGTYNSASKVTLTATTNDGYEFLGWYDGNARKEDDETYVFYITKNLSLTAKWKQTATVDPEDPDVPDIPDGPVEPTPTYTLTVVSNTHTYDDTAVAVNNTVTGGGTYEYGTEVTLTATAGEGCEFFSWSDGVTDPIRTVVVTESKEYKANFRLKIYGVVVSNEDDTKGSLSMEGSLQFHYGTPIMVTATPNQGYLFDGWYENGTLVSVATTYEFVVTAEKNLTAKWEKEAATHCNVIFDTAGGSDIPAQTVEKGATVKKPADPEQEGYVFSHWSVNTESDTAYDFSTPVTGTLLLVANWKADVFTITFYVNGEVYEVQEVEYEDVATKPKTPTREGYTFTYWTSGKEGGTYYNFSSMVEGDLNLYANWTEKTCTVVFKLDGNNYLIENVKYGEKVTEPAKPVRAGKLFSHWSVLGEGDEVYSFATPVTSDLTLIGNWTDNTFTITLSQNVAEAGSVDGAGVYEADSTITVWAMTADDNYEFLGWFIGEECVSTDEGYTFKVNGSRHLTAKWSKINYTISVILEGEEGGSVTGDGIYYRGETVTLTATAGEGYEFLGWYEGDGQIASSTTLTFTAYESRLITAKWELLAYYFDVTASPTEGGNVRGTGCWDYGMSVTLEAEAYEGYVFVGWYDGGVKVSESAIYTVTALSDKTYVAHFEKITYKIAVSASPSSGGTVTGGGTYGYDASVSVVATAKSGYTFIGWYDGEEKVSTSKTYTFAAFSDRTLTAKFEKKTCAISVSASPADGGTVSGGGTYDYGTSVSVVASEKSGYTFDGWYENGSKESSNKTYTFTATTERTLTAKFTKNKYTLTLTASSAAGGTVTGGGTYEYGEKVTITATAGTGYIFRGWSDNDTNATRTITILGNKTLTAIFGKQSYKITVAASPSDGGSVTGGGTYSYKTTVTLTATPNTGYKFTGWNDGNTSATRTVTVEKAATYTANFTKQTYTISVAKEPAAGGSVSGGGTYEYGQSVTLKATTNATYNFLGWYKGGTRVSTSATYTFTATETATYTAKWEVKAPVTTTMKELQSSGKLKVLGRTLYEGNTLVLRNSASGFEINTTASFVKMNVYTSGLFSGEYMNLKVWVDGTAKVINLTSNTSTAITLAEGLTAGTQHHIKVAKMNEPLGVGAEHANNCNIYVQSLTNNYDGDIKTAPASSSLKIEIYGDSITCGYGALGNVNDNPTEFRTNEEDATETFAYKTAMALGADINVVAHQGWAISQSRWGSAEKPLTLPAIYDKVTDAHSTAWDFSSYTPDIVIVSLGTNDYVNRGTSTPGDSYYTDFVWQYYAFMRNLAAKYPNAKFVLCYGMMDGADGTLENAIAWVQSACNGQAGDGYTALVGRVITVDLTGTDGPYMGGGGSHPSAAQHTQAAANLQAALRSAGWI